MKKDYFNLKKEQIYTLNFKIIVTLLLVLAVIPIIMGYLGLKGHYLINAPCWFLNLYFWLGITTFLSSIGIYFLKKIAVFLYIFFIILLYILFLFAYGIELQDSIFSIFFFIVIGLYAIIPRWKYFN